MNVDFTDHVNHDALDVHLIAGGTPYEETHLDNPSLPHGMTMDYGSADISWSHIGARSSDAASLFQDEPGWDRGNQGQQGTTLSYSYPSSQSPWNTQQQAQNTLSTVMDYTLDEVGSGSLARCWKLKIKKDLPLLMPKSTPSSLDLITDIDNDSVASKPTRKPGRQGPLDADGRKGASQMRHNRACLPCRFRKTRVSRGKQLHSSSN